MKDTDLLKSRRAGAPILAVETADQNAMLRMICEHAAKSIIAAGESDPVLVWDCVTGLAHANKSALPALQACMTQGEVPAAFSARTRVFPGGLMAVVKGTAAIRGLIVVAMNTHRLEDPASIQAICNTREPFKESNRTLILLAPGFSLPAELASDVLLFREALPTDEALAAIVRGSFASAQLKAPTDDVVAKAVPAVRGLSKFGVEQVCALSLSKAGIDDASLWERKVMAVNQTAGVTLSLAGAPKLADIGGLAVAREMVEKIFTGKRPPAAVVRVDEIEKAMAGATGGDNTGVSQDTLNQLLTWMQDNGHTGMIAVGSPGAGKTMFSRAIGATFGKPTIELDLGAMKHKHVGESERKVREALRVVQGLAGDGGRLFVIGTCNRLDSVPPELRRRFRTGVWMFDLPDATERAAIWAVTMKKFPGASLPMPNDEGWTGAEIFTCAEMSEDLGISLKDAAEYIVPVSQSASEQLDALRSLAEGRFNDASFPGRYSRAHRENPQTSGGRRQIAN